MGRNCWFGSKPSPAVMYSVAYRVSADLTVGCFSDSWAATSSPQQRWHYINEATDTYSHMCSGQQRRQFSECSHVSQSQTDASPQAWLCHGPSLLGCWLIKHGGTIDQSQPLHIIKMLYPTDKLLKQWGWRWEGETYEKNKSGGGWGFWATDQKSWFHQRCWQINITLNIFLH